MLRSLRPRRRHHAPVNAATGQRRTPDVADARVPALTVPAGFTTHVYDRGPGGELLAHPIPAALPVGIDLPGPSVQRSDALRDRCRLRSGDAPPDSAAGLRPARHRRQALPSPRQRQAARDAEVAQAPGGREPRDRGELNALDRAPKGPRAVRAPPGAPGPPEALEHRRPAPRVCRRPPSAGSRRRRGGGGAALAHFAIETYENGRDE